MSFSLSGSTVTQTGTDTDLSDLSSVAGVTTFVAGNVTHYTMPHKLEVQGSLSIDHNSEMLITSNNNSNTVDILNNGTLTLGVSEVSSFGTGGNVYGIGTSLIIGKNGPGCCNNGPLTVRSGGTLNINNSIINLNGVISWESGCSVNCTNGSIYSHADDNNTRIRCLEGTGININGLILYGIQFDYLTDQAFTRFTGLVGKSKGIPVENALGTVGNVREWKSIPDYTDSADAFCNNWEGQKDVKVYQSEIGSGLVIVPDNASGHGGRIFQEWDLTVVNSSNSAVADVQVYIRDTDNGSRAVTTTAGTIDETSDRIYQASTNAQGQLGTQEVMTAMWYRTNSVGDLSQPDGNEIVDVRGKTGVQGEDLFDIGLGSYLHLLSGISNVAMKGLNPLDLSWTLFDDNQITEINKTAVDAYTEIDTPAKFYDRAKAFLIDNFEGELQTLVNISGEEIDAGSYDINIDATAVSAFDFAGNQITINATQFVGNIKTTGTVTLSNGATVIGSILDATGDITVNVTTPTGYDAEITLYTNLADAEAQTNAISPNASSFKYLSTGPLAGITVFYRMEKIDGTPAIESYLTPSVSGEYNISLVITEENAAIGAILKVTDKLNSMLEPDGGVYRFTADSLEQSPGTADVNIVNVAGSPVTGINDFKADISTLATQTSIDTIDNNVDAILVDTGTTLPAQISSLNNISAEDVWTVASRTLTSIPAATLTPAERTSIAEAVEQAILNEGDGEQVLNAIVGAIGNTNVDQVALVAAIRADIERNGGMLDNVPTAAEVNAEVDTAIADANLATSASQTTILNAVNALNDFDPANDTVARVTLVDTTTTNTDMRGTDNANTVAPDNAGITAILADTDELQQNQGDWVTATGFSTHSAADIWAVASRTLTSIPAATLTPAERASIATAVEQAILNEGDGEQVLNAIVGAIGNTNVNEVALVAAIRADLERAGGAIEGVSNQVTGLNDLSTADVKAQADQALVDGDVATTANQTTITANQTVIINAITALNNLSPVDLQAALTTYGVATSTNVSDIETSLQAALAVIEGKVDVVDGIVDGIDLSGAKQALSQAIQDTVNDLDLELDGLASASALADVASKLNEVWQIHGLDPSSVLIVTKQQRSVGTIMQEITGDCVNNSQIERTM